MVQAGVYGAITHYLNAVKATGSDDGPTVVKTDEGDPGQRLHDQERQDPRGRHARSATCICSRSRSRQESKGPWDYYKQISTIPGEQAFQARPGGNECPLVKG